jgi:hypothetical protein
MLANNKSAISPTRQICKRLSIKMKLKNVKNQKSKVLAHNSIQLKTNQHHDQSHHIHH